MISNSIKYAFFGIYLSIVTPWASALTTEEIGQAEAMIDRAIAYLRTQQDAESGGWSVAPPPSPNLPAISALVLKGMLNEREISATDPAVERGIEYLLSFQKPDGGIHDGILATYNTAICLSALSLVRTAEAGAAIERAQPYLVSLQWSTEASGDMEGGAGTRLVERQHPHYGGWGYGRSGRPDLSNTSMALQGLVDSGYPTDSPAFERAVVFLQRTQMLAKTPDDETVNDQDYAEGSEQGGFIYAPSESSDAIGEGESKAGVIEIQASGSSRSELRAYGSMTYAGFKSYLYAELGRDDPRVIAAHDWLRHNWTVTENPGIGLDGYYYYLLTLAKALDVSGEDRLMVPEEETIGAHSSEHREVDWAAELIEQLSTLQNEDGSFRSLDDRWMENNPVLITAYMVLALQHAID
ncbi:MAG: prenyltransferase/squalene oxidase repeat-containing protein [Planctomycetota bacterium]